MLRSFKALVLAVLAALLVGAAVASAAFATPFSIKAEKVPTKWTAKQHGGTSVTGTDAGAISCAEITYEGDQTVTPASEISLTPTFSGCTALGFLNIPIDTNGCFYKFTAWTKVDGNFEGSTDIVCPEGKVIEVTAPGCTITFGAQTGLKTVTFTNLGAGTTRELTIDFALTGTKYEEHGKGIFPSCADKTVAKSNGTQNGALIATGENPTSKAHHGIWVE